MPISFRCTCGEAYDVADTLAGQQLRCPACQAILVVPATSVVDEVVPDSDAADEDFGAPYGLADDPRPAVDDEPEVVDEDPDVVEEFAGDESGDPEYFVAANPAKAYRVYPYGDELLVLHAGPFRWAFAGALASRSRVGEVGEVGQAGGHTAADESARAAVARRAAVLDRLTLDELRAEADANAESCRVTADNTSIARIGPPAARGPADRKKRPAIAGRVTFRHAATGTWDLVLLTKSDARMAVRAFRRVLGPENVEIASGLTDGRG
jgi:hypothetical protein